MPEFFNINLAIGQKTAAEDFIDGVHVAATSTEGTGYGDDFSRGLSGAAQGAAIGTGIELATSAAIGGIAVAGATADVGLGIAAAGGTILAGIGTGAMVGGVGAIAGAIIGFLLAVGGAKGADAGWMPQDVDLGQYIEGFLNDHPPSPILGLAVYGDPEFVDGLKLALGPTFNWSKFEIWLSKFLAGQTKTNIQARIFFLEHQGPKEHALNVVRIAGFADFIARIREAEVAWTSAFGNWGDSIDPTDRAHRGDWINAADAASYAFFHIPHGAIYVSDIEARLRADEKASTKVNDQDLAMGVTHYLVDEMTGAKIGMHAGEYGTLTQVMTLHPSAPGDHFVFLIEDAHTGAIIGNINQEQYDGFNYALTHPYFHPLTTPQIHIHPTMGPLIIDPHNGAAVPVELPRLSWFERLIEWIELKLFHKRPTIRLPGPHAEMPAGSHRPILHGAHGVFGLDYANHSDEDAAHALRRWLSDPVRSTIAIDVDGIHADEQAIACAIDTPEQAPDLAAAIQRLESTGAQTKEERIAVIGLRICRMKRATETLVARAFAGDKDAGAKLSQLIGEPGIAGCMARDYAALAEIEPLQVEAMSRPVKFDADKYPVA